jgi:hypothetical protein
MARYDKTARQALIIAWQASDHRCGKRLKALLPVLMPALRRHGHVSPVPEADMSLLRVSAATIDRLLRDVRRAEMARTRSVLPRLHAAEMEWFQGARLGGPGHLGLHLIAQHFGRAAGSQVPVLGVTDADTGWTGRAALHSWEAAEVASALSILIDGLPFRARTLSLSPGVAGFERAVGAYCASRQLEVVYPRSGRRYEEPVRPPSALSAVPAAREALAEFYAASGLYMNFFSSQAGRADPRAGATPALRVLESADVPESEKTQLRSLAETLDPLELLSRIRALHAHLRILSAGFLPVGTFRDGASRRRHWRTHRNAFESALPRLEVWQAEDPGQTSLALLNRLKREQPGIYREGQLRSLQRQLKLLREQAKRP